jgi:ribosomal protein S27AE
MDGMKRCYQCVTWKLVVEFNRNRAKGDGLASECRECGKVRHRDYFRRNREAKWARKKEVLKDPFERQKKRARRSLEYAVAKGEVEKLDSCERCGGSPVHGHHHDYWKPLEVEWLCIKCHATTHY